MRFFRGVSRFGFGFRLWENVGFLFVRREVFVKVRFIYCLSFFVV